MIFSYVRISTKKASQITDRQVNTLKEYAKANGFVFDEIVEEEISGSVKSDNRPKFNALLGKLRENDILVVTDIDRLGRNADDTIKVTKQLKERGIKLVALDTPHLNEWNNVTNDSVYDMIIDILITLKAHMAQQEREKTIARINQGIEAMPIDETTGKKVSKKTGNVIGRPTLELPKGFKKYYEQMNNKQISKVEMAKLLECSRKHLYTMIKKYEEQQD